MKKALFFVLPEKGHINPYIGPAQALKQKGCEVIFAAPADIKKQIEAAGLRFTQELLSDRKSEQPMQGKDLVELIKAKAAMKAWIQSLLLNVNERDVENYLRFINEQKPNLIVVDPLYYAAVIAAVLSGVPWVSMSNSLNPVLEDDVKSDLLDTLNEINVQRQSLFSRFSVDVSFSGCDALSPYLTVAFCTEEFVGQRSGEVKMLGPSWPIGKRGDEVAVLDLPTEPFIFASFGSQIYYWPEIFKKLITATEQLGISLVLSVGDLYDELSLELRPHVKLFKYAPQLKILPKASLFITHGGANSVMEALASGTPIWLSPMCNDQFHQAHYIQKKSIGWVQDISLLDVSEIKNSILAIQQSDYKTKMSRVTASYQTNASEKFAELVKKWI